MARPSHLFSSGIISLPDTESFDTDQLKRLAMLAPNCTYNYVQVHPHLPPRVQKKMDPPNRRTTPGPERGNPPLGTGPFFLRKLTAAKSAKKTSTFPDGQQSVTLNDKLGEDKGRGQLPRLRSQPTISHPRQDKGPTSHTEGPTHNLLSIVDLNSRAPTVSGVPLQRRPCVGRGGGAEVPAPHPSGGLRTERRPLQEPPVRGGGGVNELIHCFSQRKTEVGS